MINDAPFVEGADPQLEKKLAGFLDKHTRSAETEGDLTIKLSQKGSQSEMGVKDFIWSQGETVDDLVADVIDCAVEDALLYPGKKTRYVVRIEDAGGRVRGDACIFLLGVPKTQMRSDPDYEGPDEPPDDAGIKGQLMRHVEITTRMLLDVSQTGREELLRLNHELMAENRNLRQENSRLMGQMEDVRNIGWIRDMERDRIVAERQQQERFLNGITRAGIPFAASLMGAPPEMVAKILQSGPGPQEQGPPPFAPGAVPGGSPEGSGFAHPGAVGSGAGYLGYTPFEAAVEELFNELEANPMVLMELASKLSGSPAQAKFQNVMSHRAEKKRQVQAASQQYAQQQYQAYAAWQQRQHPPSGNGGMPGQGGQGGQGGSPPAPA